MTLETSLANIIINNNTIDQGRFSDGTTPATVNYAFHAWIYGSANISHNTFMGPAAASDMLNLENSSSKISNNKFIRGATSITSYIKNHGTQDQVIVENVFDQTTIDGTNEAIVSGLTSTSTYERNINQIAYLVLSLVEDMAVFDTYLSASAGQYFSGDRPSYGSDPGAFASKFQFTGKLGFDRNNENPLIGLDAQNYLFLADASATEHQIPRTFSKVFNLNTSLPSGAMLLSAKIGMKMNTNPGGLNVAGSDFNNQFLLRLVVSNDVLTSHTNGITDPVANLTPNTSNNFGDIITDNSEWSAFTDLIRLSTGFGGGGDAAVSENFNTFNYRLMNEAGFISAAQFLTVSPVGSPSEGRFKNTPANNRRISISFDAYYKTGASTIGVVFIASPILIKYRW